MNECIIVPVYDEMDIIVARQKGRELASEIQFSVIDRARITTVISELARNIYLYTNCGIIELKALESDVNSRKGMQIRAVDSGPGIKDIRLVLESGYSTSGGLGAGISGVRRMMDEFYITSKLGDGTEIIAIKWRDV